MTKMEDVETRIDIFIRIMGFTFLLIGIAITYYAATTPLLPQVSPIFYFLALLFLLTGIITVIAKYR